MELTRQRIELLNVALNEATLNGADVDVERRSAAITLSVLAMPEEGPPPEDPRVYLVLWPLGRVAASFRHGRWDDSTAPVEEFGLDDLVTLVGRVGGGPIYGWEFFDVPEQEDFAKWRDRLSLDWRASDAGGMSHTLILFQETDGPGILDLCFWFDEVSVFTTEYEEVPLDEFAAAGKRWWDGLYSNDPRTKQSGMFPLNAAGTKALQETLDELNS